MVKLDGIMLLSGTDGWLQDYTVETSLDGLSWNLSATVKASTVVLRYIKFDNGPLDSRKLRVTITAAMNDFSRIHELSPVYAAVSADTITTKSSPSPSPSPSPSTTTTTTTTPITTPAVAEAEAPPAPPSPVNTSKKTKPNMAEVIAGVLAGLAGILLGLQAYILWLLRKKQQMNGSNMISTYMSTTGVGVGVVEGAAVGGGQTVIIGDDLSHQNDPIIGFSFHTITATSELVGSQQHNSELVGKRYPRVELALFFFATPLHLTPYPPFFFFFNLSQPLLRTQVNWLLPTNFVKKHERCDLYYNTLRGKSLERETHGITYSSFTFHLRLFFFGGRGGGKLETIDKESCCWPKRQSLFFLS